MRKDIIFVQEFHGHLCPGLAIGIRVAEKAIQEMGQRPGDEEVVAIVETDNCAVDAIQFITGCTFGKGNLIHLPYGKNAFRFIRRADGKAIRILVKPNFGKSLTPEQDQIMKKYFDPQATPQEKELAEQLRQAQIEHILTAPLEDLVQVQTIKAELPARAKIFRSENCDRCQEKTMEIRHSLLNGQKLCPECYQSAMDALNRYN